jgi:hypothetical protein
MFRRRSAVCVLYAAQTCDRVWFVRVLRYCEPCYGRLPLIQAGHDVESIPSACRSLRPRDCVDGVGVPAATRVTP